MPPRPCSRPPRRPVPRRAARGRLATGLLTLVLVLTAPQLPLGRGHGPAQAWAEEAEARARERFKEGQVHFAAGRYREAATAYEAAYAAKPLPAFLFNLGQCYRNLDEPARAITYFKAYLLDAQNIANKDAIQRTIRELEAQMRARGNAAAAAPAPAAPPSAPLLPAAPAASAEPGVQVDTAGTSSSSAPVYRRWWFWTGVGVVVVASILGGVLGARGGTTDTGASLGDVRVPAGGR